MPEWRQKTFADITPQELHAALKLRSDVFVVEQNCAFTEIDGADPQCLHLMGWDKDELLAYCRLVPPGMKFKEWAIGRVVTSAAARRTGLGRELMQRAIDAIHKMGGGNIRIDAQAYLEKFYDSFGFHTVRGPYDEDGIPHVEMVKKG